MRVKTSVTLPGDLLAVIDQVEQRKQRDARDAKIINANAKRLNAEARDVLGYQRLP